MAQRKVIYSMGVSLDGFIAGPDGDIAWSAPDEELHRFHNEQARGAGAHLYGRRLYEAMRYWETAEQQNPTAPEHELEFAQIWRATPKLVVSRTLLNVQGDYELVRTDIAERVARLKEEADGDIDIGGAGLAASFMTLGLIDEFRPFVYPVVLGAGTPYFPALDTRIELRLAETRAFPSGVVYARYEVVRSP